MWLVCNNRIQDDIPRKPISNETRTPTDTLPHRWQGNSVKRYGRVNWFSLISLLVIAVMILIIR